MIASPSGTISRSHAHTNNLPTFFVPLPSCTLTANLSLRFPSRTARSWNDLSDPMLITPRTYSASQTPDQAAADSRTESAPRFYTLAGWRQSLVEDNPTADMLLVHQTGSVRVGEIIRYVLCASPNPIRGYPGDGLSRAVLLGQPVVQREKANRTSFAWLDIPLPIHPQRIQSYPSLPSFM